MIKYIEIPKVCPVCGGTTEIVVSDSGVKNLICTNPNCEGKTINKLNHFCSKDRGLDIKGLSKATIEKLIDWGWVNNIIDLYSLKNYRQEWIKKPGFGIASVDKLLNAIEESKKCKLESFISALGIPLIGKVASKEICRFYCSWEEFRAAVGGDWTAFQGFGYEMSAALNNFDYAIADELAQLMDWNWELQQLIDELPDFDKLSGLTFCVTGKLNEYKNRDELKSTIESMGGKVVGSISAKVNYLINNDVTSTSSKNKAAATKNIPIISEKEFKEKFNI